MVLREMGSRRNRNYIYQGMSKYHTIYPTTQTLEAQFRSLVLERSIGNQLVDERKIKSRLENGHLST